MTAVVLLMVVPVVVSVAGQFFIEWARELGWYDQPSKTGASIMETLASITGSLWFLGPVFFLAGASTTLWLEHWLRRSDSAEASALIDEETKELAGIVSALTDYSLLRDRSTSTTQGAWLGKIKDSTHAIWTDPETNMLRRMFLRQCEVVRHEKHAQTGVIQLSKERTHLRNVSMRLIQRLL